MAIVGAIAVPHPPLIVATVGRGEEARVQATIDAYAKATRAVLERQPDVLVVTSPHAPLFRDAFHVTTDATLEGDMARFNAPDERIRATCDVEFAHEIMRLANEAGVPALGNDRYRSEMDHGTYVPLYFVRQEAEAIGELGASSGKGLVGESNTGEGNAAASNGTVAPGRTVASGSETLPTATALPDSASMSNGVAKAADGFLPYPIVRIGLAGLSADAHRELGRVIAHAADALGRRVGFIASGDLSHKLLPEGPYGFASEGPVFDERVCELFASGDLEALFDFDDAFCEAAAECGLRSFQIMAGALDGLAVDCKLLSHQGTFGVGYGVATCMPRLDESCETDGKGAAPNAVPNATSSMMSDAAPNAASRAAQNISSGSPTSVASSSDPYVALARLAVEVFVRTGKAAEVPTNVAPELLGRQAGVFVSLHERGELRGCIGTIGPTCASIADEIVQNGVSACSRDPRFSPVRPDELDFLDYSVDVLAPPESIESPGQLDPSRYGVIVTKGRKRGLLLPNLDGVDTVGEQLTIAKRKAGIDPTDDEVELERFEVVRHTRGGEPKVS